MAQVHSVKLDCEHVNIVHIIELSNTLSNYLDRYLTLHLTLGCEILSHVLALPVLSHTFLLFPSHKPATEWEERSIYRSPGDQDTEVKSNARM